MDAAGSRAPTGGGGPLPPRPPLGRRRPDGRGKPAVAVPLPPSVGPRRRLAHRRRSRGRGPVHSPERPPAPPAAESPTTGDDHDDVVDGLPLGHGGRRKPYPHHPCP